MIRFLPGSRAPHILQKHTEGMGAKAIACALDCTPSTVYKTIRRYKVRQPAPAKEMKISALAPDEAYWLKCEARRLNVAWPDLARALLKDAIEEARRGC